MEVNELNKNAMGGTELMAHRIETMIGPELLAGVQIIHSRARNIDPNRKTIYVLHDLPNDPEVQHLKNDGWKKYDLLVFVSHWQKQAYETYLGIPPSAGIVISNAIVPIEDHHKPADKVRLIYFSTPHRGLEILYPVFDALYKQHKDNIELKVFSSFDLYGWESRDAPYAPLFAAMKDHPGVAYSKSISNDQIREELKHSHIFAYPSIWPETSCLCLIEAMSAGLTCVHSSLAALPETSMGLTHMYEYHEDINVHANRFYEELNVVIKSHYIDKDLDLTRDAANAKFGVHRKTLEWKKVTQRLIHGT